MISHQSSLETLHHMIFGYMMDGRNPAPVDRLFIPLFIGFQPFKVVKDFFHPLYDGNINHPSSVHRRHCQLWKPQRKARVSAEEWLMAVESAEAQHFGPVTDGEINTVTDGVGIYERFIWDLHGMFL